MRLLLRLEDLSIALLAAYLFVMLGYAWWLLAVLFLVPDISMVGYALNPRAGAITYNIIHHRGLAVAILGVGLAIHGPIVQAVGLVLLFHSSTGRVLGYGLKHLDSFQDTHLGMIGKGPDR